MPPRHIGDMDNSTPLQQHMADRSLTDAALSRQTKVGRIHIGRIRRGERGASLKVALKLAEATGLPAAAFAKDGT